VTKQEVGDSILKHIIKVLAALTLGPTAALAADMPLKAVAPVIYAAPVWSGFYIGGNAGFRQDKITGTDWFGDFPTPIEQVCDQWDQWKKCKHYTPGSALFDNISAPIDNKSNTAVIGLHAGYNYQFWNSWLAGIEGDVTYGRDRTNTTFTSASPVFNTTTVNVFDTTVNGSASLRGRLGYVLGNWMFYGTGGVSWLNMSVGANGGFSDSIDLGPAFSTYSTTNFEKNKTITGGIFGGGVEYMLAGNQHWILRAEYLYADYGNVNFGDATINSAFSDNFFCRCAVTTTTTAPVSAHVTTQTVRGGLSYKF
jgi:opacity protein-like surface antigen